VGWPACGEIDIMEMVGNKPNVILGTVHHPNHSGGNADGGSTTITNASTEFHTYSLDWSASSIKFYVDDKLFYTFANNSSLPFNKDFFFIMNIALGGNLGGTIDPAFTTATMEVDYIRVYQ
jgi:beta-glucanase (GH16 family)